MSMGRTASDGLPRQRGAIMGLSLLLIIDIGFGAPARALQVLAASDHAELAAEISAIRNASQAPFGRSVGVSPRCSIGFIMRVRRMELSGRCGWLILPRSLLRSHASTLPCPVWQKR